MGRYEYDIFISFKNSTQSGGNTPDREVAERFYKSFVAKGMRVFFSNATLPNLGADRFMLELETALEAARTLLLVFSDGEYLRDGWVRKEWTTFMNLALADKSGERRIFLYSLDGTVGKPPVFLREYECFTSFEHAVSHISNERHDAQAPQPFGTRDFFNAYWGILGSHDPCAAVERFARSAQAQALDNFPVYRIRQALKRNGRVCGGDVQELRRHAEDGNTMAAHLLAMHHRDVRHLDLPFSQALRRDAYKHFLQRMGCGIDETASAGHEISLVVWQEKPEYNGAFSMAEMMADVLSAYGISCAFRVVQQPEGVRARDLADNDSRRVLAFFSEHFFDRDAGFMDWLVARKERLLLGMNAFSAELIPPPLRGCFTFDGSDAGITLACRELLGS